MKYWIFWIVPILVLVPSCNGEEDGAVPIANQNPELLKSQESAILPWSPPSACKDEYVYTTDPNFDLDPNYEQDYKFKSGTIILEGWKGSKDSILERWRAVVYFDDYGHRERRDNFLEDGTHAGVFFRIGNKNFCLDPTEKTAHVSATGHTVLGTETRFDNIVQNMVGATDKPIKEILAGKECDVYVLQVEGGTSKYAGFGNIVFLMEFFSEGWGDYSKRVIEFSEGPVDPALFQIPKDYTIDYR